MLWALFAGLVASPAAVLAISAAFDAVHVGETVSGALVGSLFFAITAFAALAFKDSPELKFVVLSTYVIKTGVLAGLLLVVPFDGVDRNAVAIATVVSAFAYLITQSVLITHGERRFRLQL